MCFSLGTNPTIVLGHAALLKRQLHLFFSIRLSIYLNIENETIVTYNRLIFIHS